MSASSAPGTGQPGSAPGTQRPAGADPDPVRPPWLDAPPVEPYPFEESHDLRVGPKLHPALNALLPYIGLWRGRGRGGYPTIEDFDYAQEIRISHDGRPFLRYESRAWLLDEQSHPVRPVGRELGWWRAVTDAEGRATGELEATMMTPTGVMELYLGRITGVQVELATDAVVRTGTAKEVTGGHRLFGIVEGALLYAQEMAAVGQPLSPHLSARLIRVGG
ncbi:MULTISPECIES: FABP family protein [unclassified Solwaraspora]|uniref:FABP family protein n=1 Tax=unclassified Solwaraspora TaxID=2627926 RepID=UPI00259B0190|nr:FABP family protein [Solwaraspora sp. WMMA2056]WJK40971.1 FABP family protein [Solwaraspora sp. WMMA2056]